MKILYFSRAYTPHDQRFLQKMAESPHEIKYLRLTSQSFDPNPRPWPSQVQEVSWPEGWQPARTPADWLHLMPAYEAILKEVQPDLVHAGPVQSCGFMTALAGYHPLLLMSWGSDILRDAERDDLWRWLTRYTLQRTDIFLCDCQAVLDKALTFQPLPLNCLIKFPWGVDLHSLGPGADNLELRRRLAWEDAVVVLSTRSWEEIYGIEVAMEAFAQAYAHQPRLRLLLLGQGSLAPVIDRMITVRGLEAVVYRPGLVSPEQMPLYFKAADLYLSCSYSDGTSVSLLEAMASGLPAVVSDLAGNREWLVPGKHGWLSPPGEPGGFARLILKAASLSEVERRRISEASRRVVAERADWQQNSRRLLALYDQIDPKNRRTG